MSLWLAALYTYGCPELEKKEAKKIFKFIKDPKKEKDVVKILAKLEPWVWYQVIGRKNNLFFLSPEVIEAYWLGSEDLDVEFRREDLGFLSEVGAQETVKVICAVKGRVMKEKEGFPLHLSLIHI